MPVKTGSVLLLTVLLLLVTVCDGGGEFPATVLTLSRAFPANKRVELDVLKARDRVRHARILQGFTGGVVDFNVFGTSDPYYGGLYYTKVKLGSPPKEFNVQIDTGSDILWVTCSSCSDCPDTSGFGMPLNFFDAASSSTASMVSCSDRICSSNIKIADASCSDEFDQCSYEFRYADNSGTSAQGITPKVFSHCLLGDGTGGGKLVLGEIVAPNMVYSPIVPSQAHYNLELQSITVGEQLLSIDASAFATSDIQGTIVDTGTTLSYLTAQAYEPFVDAITAAVSQSATPISLKDMQCYLVTSSSSIATIFPEISLNFAGNAPMIVKPEKYLVQGDPIEGGVPWCIGFQKASNGLTVLGDIVLKDKIFVYDLSRNRMGWTDYDCSAEVNVSIKSYNNEYLDGHLSASISLRFTSLDVLLVHILLWSLLW
ncbi:hypothetical protein M8C21_003315 [Ambrosia artemisiifolia]|uniref:Peptidase A1 domain-containing protein n=1 Tax=Ambrosia artemisiifolia TaxID=4212 RepID=A0AAD5BLM7_AMBAR|nr:hypothetical protein M8C21_003315 [Ambrosia artemisiifolia]